MEGYYWLVVGIGSAIIVYLLFRMAFIAYFYEKEKFVDRLHEKMKGLDNGTGE